MTNPGAQAFAEGAPVSLWIQAQDPESLPLVFGASGLPAELGIDPVTGEIHGTLGYESAASYAVTVTAHDGFQAGEASFALDVINTNRAPEYAGPTTISFQRLIPASVPFVANDPDGDLVTIDATGLPPGIGWTPASETADGTATTAGQYPGTLELSDGAAPVSVPVTWVVTTTACTNGIDDDGDGAIDIDGGPAGGARDPDCKTAAGTAESSPVYCGLGAEVGLFLAPLFLLRRRRGAGLLSLGVRAS